MTSINVIGRHSALQWPLVPPFIHTVRHQWLAAAMEDNASPIESYFKLSVFSQRYDGDGIKPELPVIRSFDNLRSLLSYSGPKSSIKQSVKKTKNLKRFIVQ